MAALSICVYIGALPIALFAAALFPIHGLFGRFVYSPFADLGSRLYREAQQLAGLRITEIRARDTRRPVLFLRSFSDDRQRVTRKFGPGSLLAPKTLSLEEVVVERSWKIGPVIALGRPGEALSPLGAAREYVEGVSWQQRVGSLLAEAKLTVVILGTSQGLAAEYEMISQMGITEKLVAVFPPVNPASARRRWQILRRSSITSSSFPETEDRNYLLALFPPREPALFFISKYQNESTYLLALDVAMSYLEKYSLPAVLRAH